MGRVPRFLCLVLALVTLAAPAAAETWEKWTAHDPASAQAVDHGQWDDFLARYVHARDGINRVAYAKVTPEDRAALAGYIGHLAATRITGLNRDQQRALWINLYNALTVKVILDHYPVATIRDIDISPGLFSNGPWRRALVTVEGEPLSLDDIEHRILLPIWKDPRLHYVVNCASIGCPQLPDRALTADNTESQLDKAARAFINHRRAVRVEGGNVVVSSLYSWYRDDFGDSDQELIDHFRKYADPALAAALGTASAVRNGGYDWLLNDAH